MYIFISHSSNEADMAKDICKAIEAGGNQCFLAPRDIRSGYEYAEEIANAIDRSDAVLLMLSEAANKSPHVLREIERAVSKSVPVLVYKLEEVTLTKSMEYFLMTHQWLTAGKDSYEDVVRYVTELGKIGFEKEAFVKTEEQVDRKECGKDKREVPKEQKGVKWICPLILGSLAAAVLLFVIGSGFGNMRPKQELCPGDTVIMGNYNDEDIYWRVLKVSEDGTEATLVAREVVTVKAFDAAESGKYNHDGTNNYNFYEAAQTLDEQTKAYVKGSSIWADSNIRTWLNSASENVKYEGQAPVSAAMADGMNGYSGEKGFLCSFTAEELEMLKTTTVATKGNVLYDAETVMTEDKVFLLSLEELAWFEEADVSLLAVPTEGAVKKNETYWYQNYCLDYGVDSIMWWLREPVADSACKCYLVGNGYYEENIYTWEVGVESFGIRPAIVIDLTVGKVEVIE